MRYYDIDQDGNISYEEFIRGLRYLLAFSYISCRDELTERKKATVLKAFKMLDRDGSGVIQARDVIAIYDVSNIKEYQEGKKSKEQLIEEFLYSFEGVKGNRDGRIICIPSFSFSCCCLLFLFVVVVGVSF